MKFRLKAIGLTVAVAVVLTACGGGGGGSTTTSATPSTLGGTAAVGFPIIGAVVHVTCASGSALISQPTSATGAWQVTLSGQTFPCAAEATGGTINNAANSTLYHSIASAAGTLNITPLTDLIAAILAQTAALDTWFSTLNPALLAQINAASVNSASTLVQTQLNLAQLGSSINPMTTSFTPAAGSVMDDTLTAFANALGTAPLAHANFRTQAISGPSFTAPAGFANKIALAYTVTNSGKSTASTPVGVAVANTTTGTAANGTPAIAGANCSLKYGANTYMRCSANAIANFPIVSLVDATDGQTCTASYNNGMLIVTKGQLRFITDINGDFIDSLTTVGTGASETIGTVTGFFLGYMTNATGLATITSSVTWNAAGVLKNIQGQNSSTGYSAQFSCTQP